MRRFNLVFEGQVWGKASRHGDEHEPTMKVGNKVDDAMFPAAQMGKGTLGEEREDRLNGAASGML